MEHFIRLERGKNDPLPDEHVSEQGELTVLLIFHFDEAPFCLMS